MNAVLFTGIEVSGSVTLRIGITAVSTAGDTRQQYRTRLHVIVRVQQQWMEWQRAGSLKFRIASYHRYIHQVQQQQYHVPVLV